MPHEPDPDVLRRFAAGDRSAFEQLFRMFEAEVYRWALRIVRNTAVAEDVVIEAFWRACRAHGRFDPSKPFGAWIRRIATNAAYDQLRSGRRAPTDEPLPANLAASGAPDAGVREAVEAALQALSPKLRIVAILALVEEAAYADIADALALPIGTVKSRVFRATRQLRRELNRLGVRP